RRRSPPDTSLAVSGRTKPYHGGVEGSVFPSRAEHRDPAMSLLDVVTRFLNPGKNPDLDLAFRHNRQHLPILWLLGKTGAGKSTLVQTLTGLSGIEIGKGFRPCTLTAVQYDHPAATPVVSF